MAEIRNTGSEFRTRSLTLAVLNVSAFETLREDWKSSQLALQGRESQGCGE